MGINTPEYEDYGNTLEWLKLEHQRLGELIQAWSETDPADTTAEQRRGLEIAAKQIDLALAIFSFIYEP